MAPDKNPDADVEMPRAGARGIEFRSNHGRVPVLPHGATRMSRHQVLDLSESVMVA